jgi:hypothetical protein
MIFRCGTTPPEYRAHLAAHPFYTRLNQILDKHDFDAYVEGLCERFYADDELRCARRPSVNQTRRSPWLSSGAAFTAKGWT